MGAVRLRAAASLAALCSAFLPGCAPDTPQAPEARTNTRSLRVGALGNSITAGFINGGIVIGGQKASYPNLVSRRAGGPDLEMLFVDAPGVGPDLRTPLFVNEMGVITTEEVADPITLILNFRYPKPYDNLAVPGAITKELLTATSSVDSDPPGNVFFDFLLRNAFLPPGGRTAVDQMADLAPQILLLWIGNNDILRALFSGDVDDVTPVVEWEAHFVAVLDAVENSGIPMVAVANLPALSNIPFVTHLPLGVPGDEFRRYNMEEDLDGDADEVVHVLLDAPVFDPDRAGDFLPEGFTGSSRDTLPAELTLTASELEAFRGAAAAFNAIIRRETLARGYAHVDAAGILESLPRDLLNGPFSGGLNAGYAWLDDPGGGGPFQNVQSAFSLDGIHPSEKGQGLSANAFIEALNDRYGLDIPLVDLDGVENVTGFERVRSGASVRGAGSGLQLYGMDPGGRRGLGALATLLVADPAVR